MSRNTTEEYTVNNDILKPTSERVMDPLSYTCAWIGGNISVAIFMVGASFVPPAGQLNLLQAFIALLLGLTGTAVALTINGAAGHKYGIPYVVHARTAFGTIGLKLPALLRGIPALVWFGVQSWVGASAVNTITTRMFGFDNLILMFILFQILQAILSLTGMKGIKIIENVGVVVIFLSVIYMTYTLFTTFGGAISENLINIKGSWGLPFWGSVTMALGFSATIITNISDFTRDVSKNIKTRWTTPLHWVAFVPTNMFLGLIGLLTAGVTGEWDPIMLFTKMLPDSPVLIVSLIFIAFAQITTNLYNNLVPATFVFMDITKISQKKSAFICVFLSIATFPWKIATASTFIIFIQICTAFFGPIFAVLVTDYYIMRKQTLDIDKLYNPKGPFVGINWQGIIAILVGAASSLLIPELAWFITLLPAAITYFLLSKFCPISKSFIDGTIFDEHAKFIGEEKTQ